MEFHAWGYFMFFKIALVDFEGIEDLVRARMDALGVEGLELMDFFNNEVGVNVSNI